jgi:hypothetical protein
MLLASCILLLSVCLLPAFHNVPVVYAAAAAVDPIVAPNSADIPAFVGVPALADILVNNIGVIPVVNAVFVVQSIIFSYWWRPCSC